MPRHQVRSGPALLLTIVSSMACADDTTATSQEASTGGTSDSADTSTSGDPSTTASSSSADGSSTSTGNPDTSGETTAASTESSGSTDPTTDTGSSGVGPESSSGSSGESSSDTGSESTGSSAIVCPAGDFGALLPAVIMGSTVGQDSEFSSACGGGGAPDIAYTFTAPADGPYTFDTFGSALDTVLSVRDGLCEGTVLDCNDNGIGQQSLVSVDLVADQTVTVVVDGFALQGDDFTVTVTAGQVDCPRADLGSTVPQTVSDNSAIGIDEFAPSCGGTANDVGYLFTAPAAGDYTFDTIGSGFDTVLAVYDAACMGNELGCSNNFPGAGGGASGLVVPLLQDQQVTVVVDGALDAQGLFDLSIGVLAGSCPDADLGNAVPQATAGSTAPADNTLGGSCGGAFGVDQTFTFTATAAGLYTFDTAGSDYDTVVYVRDGACDGVELGCNNDGVGQTSLLAVPLEANQDVVVVLDGQGAGGNYQLAIDTLSCPGPALAGPLPLAQIGSTAGLPNVLLPPCSPSSTAPEATYTFTAPADGNYIFDTEGSAFDTVLYLYDGAQCGGTSPGCDDDGGVGVGASRLEHVMLTGETVTVVVDGYLANAGNFTLNVSTEQPPMCTVDEDLGMLAVPIADAGVTAGASEIAVPCGLEGGAPEYVYTWTAPAAGSYQLDTNGSAFDTVLHVYNGATCGFDFLGCNDDGGDGLQSLLDVVLAAGQQITIVVDGYNANAGAFDFNITAN